MTFHPTSFLASLLGYPLLDRLLTPLLFTNLPPSRSKIFRNRLLSSFHSLWTSSLCLYLSTKNFPPPSIPLTYHPLSPPQLLHKVISAEIGYLVQDALSVLPERHSSLSFDPLVDAVLLHHTILAILFSAYEIEAVMGGGKARTEYYMACLLVMGASNVLMHAGWLVERLAPKSNLMKVLRATTWPSFMFFRFMVFVWVYYIFARSKGESSWWKAPLQLRTECKVGSVAFIAFNGWLGWVLFVKSYLKKRKIQ